MTRFLTVLAILAILWAPASARAQKCGQPLSDGAVPTASDCLFILKAAVGTESCSPECICAPSGTLPVKATDALLCLAAAVGTSLSLDCPCAPTTTATTVPTTTTTITLPPGDIDNDGLGDDVDPCPDTPGIDLALCQPSITINGVSGDVLALETARVEQVVGELAMAGPQPEPGGRYRQAGRRTYLPHHRPGLAQEFRAKRGVSGPR